MDGRIELSKSVYSAGSMNLHLSTVGEWYLSSDIGISVLFRNVIFCGENDDWSFKNRSGDECCRMSRDSVLGKQFDAVLKEHDRLVALDKEKAAQAAAETAGQSQRKTGTL